MFGVGPATRIYLAAGATDMRKGFEGLHGLVRDRLACDPLSGHVFLFANAQRNRLKLLFWDGSGLWVCAKRSDIHHHVAARLGNRQTRADRRHHRLLHQMHFARLRAIRRIHNRALFHLRNLARHADHNARMHQHLPVMRLVDEVIQHLLGDFEVSDDAVLHRLDGDNIAGRAAQHFLRLFTDRLNFAGRFVQRDNRRLIDNNAFSFRENQRVGGAKVNG